MAAMALLICGGFMFLLGAFTYILEPKQKKVKKRFVYKEKYAELIKETNRSETFRSVV